MDKKPYFSIKDVEILQNSSCWAGFLSVDGLRLRHRLYEGGWSPEFSREVLRRSPGAGVLLYDPELDMVLMVEQFRAGCLDNPKGPWVLGARRDPQGPHQQCHEHHRPAMADPQPRRGQAGAWRSNEENLKQHED